MCLTGERNVEEYCTNIPRLKYYTTCVPCRYAHAFWAIIYLFVWALRDHWPWMVGARMLTSIQSVFHYTVEHSHSAAECEHVKVSVWCKHVCLRLYGRGTNITSHHHTRFARYFSHIKISPVARRSSGISLWKVLYARVSAGCVFNVGLSAHRLDASNTSCVRVCVSVNPSEQMCVCVHTKWDRCQRRTATTKPP